MRNVNVTATEIVASKARFVVIKDPTCGSVRSRVSASPVHHKNNNNYYNDDDDDNYTNSYNNNDINVVNKIIYNLLNVN